MDEPDPRYEFRVFAPAPELAAARARLAEAALASERDTSDALYLLTPDPTRNLKLRGDRLEEKRRVACRGDLEQWRPEASLPLPLAADTLRRWLAPRLGIGGHGLAPRGGPFDAEALREVVARAPRARAVAVRKRRTRWRGEGWLAESVRLELDPRDVPACAGARSLTSLAIESTDPETVEGWRRTLGLEGHANESYPRALWRILDDPPAARR
jgi:hypothetical protein